MKKWVIIMISCALPVGLILTVISPFVIATTVNNAHLRQFSRQLYACPLPDGTSAVQRRQVCGKLNGNGNGMDFLAALLVRTSLTQEELRAYYEGAGFRPVKERDGREEDGPTVEIVKPTSPRLESEYLEHGQITFSGLEGRDSYDGYYIVVLYDGGYPADFDLRGH